MVGRRLSVDALPIARLPTAGLWAALHDAVVGTPLWRWRTQFSDVGLGVGEQHVGERALQHGELAGVFLVALYSEPVHPLAEVLTLGIVSEVNVGPPATICSTASAMTMCSTASEPSG